MPLTRFSSINPAEVEVSQETLDRVDAIADEDIDYSDIPELDDEFFAKAVRLRDLPDGHPLKPAPPLIQPDILEAFKARGDDWRGRIDHVLREALQSETDAAE